MDCRSGEGHVCGSSEAVFAGVPRKKLQKLKLAKCIKCGRLNPFRPKPRAYNTQQSVANTAAASFLLAKTGESGISKGAEIFYENCEDDCRQYPFNKLTSDTLKKTAHQMKIDVKCS